MRPTEKADEASKKRLHSEHVLHTLVWALAIPLSMSFWILNLIYSRVVSSEGYDEPVVIPPTRWLAACFIPIIIIMYGYRRKSLSLSGALLSFVVGFVLTLGSFCFLAVLFTFFITSSRATKFRSHMKKNIEEDFKEGGQRNWVQVLCNGGMATQLGILYLMDVGSSEMPIDFVKDYRASWLSIGILGALASCNGDTWASELGSVLTRSDPWLVTTGQRVPKGTNGGVTIVGTIFSALGGLVVGLAHYVVILYYVDSTVLSYNPPQWLIVPTGALGGFLGSLIDSILGATVQYSGVDKDGKIVSHSSAAVKHISGRNLLDNHSVNLLSSILTGLLLPTISKVIWPLFT